jgi:hypothetical protein
METVEKGVVSMVLQLRLRSAMASGPRVVGSDSGMLFGIDGTAMPSALAACSEWVATDPAVMGSPDFVTVSY